MNFIQKNLKILFPILIGVIYGTCIRIMISFDIFKDGFGVMSLGFIFIVPFVIGFITVYLGTSEQRKSWNYKIGAPIASSMLCFIVAFLVGWEGLICLVMGIPIYITIAVIGGVISGVILSKMDSKMNSFAFGAILLMPIISTQVEKEFPLPVEIRKVQTSIILNSTQEKVWKHIIKIPKITESQNSIFYSMGFPRPVEATLSFEGIGGVREARFEKGLLFIETINLWEENKKIGFTIFSDPKNTPITTLDEHVVVGGNFFDALYGEYEIEKISETQIKLLLHSKYRLSTRFNFYASIWGDFLMRDIQNNILTVIQTRVEKN